MNQQEAVGDMRDSSKGRKRFESVRSTTAASMSIQTFHDQKTQFLPVLGIEQSFTLFLVPPKVVLHPFWDFTRLVSHVWTGCCILERVIQKRIVFDDLYLTLGIRHGVSRPLVEEIVVFPTWLVDFLYLFPPRPVLDL
jgi:hypothetical protein